MKLYKKHGIKYRYTYQNSTAKLKQMKTLKEKQFNFMINIQRISITKHVFYFD